MPLQHFVSSIAQAARPYLGQHSEGFAHHLASFLQCGLTVDAWDAAVLRAQQRMQARAGHDAAQPLQRPNNGIGLQAAPDRPGRSNRCCGEQRNPDRQRGTPKEQAERHAHCGAGCAPEASTAAGASGCADEGPNQAEPGRQDHNRMTPSRVTDHHSSRIRKSEGADEGALLTAVPHDGSSIDTSRAAGSQCETTRSLSNNSF